MKWEIEYFDGEDFVAWIGAAINEVYSELGDNGEIHAYFYVWNTPANRALLQQDLLINIFFNNELQYTGILQGGDIEDRPGKIKCVVYDDLLITLDQAESFTGAYEKSAKDIATDILSGTGYTIDAGCPTNVIMVIFYHANRLDAMHFLAKALGAELFHIGTTVYLGTQGAGITHTPTSLTLSRRGIDRSKQATKVEVRGTDVTGFHILGVAGTGTKVKTFNESQMCDEATLNAIAAKKLVELQSDSSGLPVSLLMSEGKDCFLGESVSITNDRYLLDSTYRIMQLTKSKFKCTMQLDRMRKGVAATVDELKGWEQKGIYTPGSEAWLINLQGLVGLFHLNEGEGAVAKNRAPVDTPINGTITDCFWEDGPITKILTFNGTTAVVDLGAASQAGINFTDKFSVGAWFSPSANDSILRRVLNKSLQFDLQYHVSTGVLTFQLYTGGSWHQYDSDAGLIKVGGRVFAMVTYDRQKVRMYYNGWLHKEWVQTGAPASSTGNVYLGSNLKGVLFEVMLWSRAIVDQEVLELYFFPLLRVVGGGGGESGWWCSVSVSNDQHGTTDPSGVLHIATGTDLTVTATKINQAKFLCWRYDGTDFYSTNNPVTIPAEADRTHHSLIAIFTPPIGIGLPVLCAIAAIPHTEITTPKIVSISAVGSASANATQKWGVFCNSCSLGTFNPTGLQLVNADKIEDSYVTNVTGTYAGIQALHPSATTSISAVVQSFRGNGGALVKVQVRLMKSGSPVGNLRAALYAHSGVYGTSSVPTGALIEDSADVAMASLGTTFDWVTFTFSGATTLTAGTNYCLVVYAKSVTTLNTSHYVRVNLTTSSSLHQGNYSKYASSAWAATATTDVFFVVNSGSGGQTLAIVAYPNNLAGYVSATLGGISLDGVSVGVLAPDGLSVSYTIPAQISGTLHDLSLSDFVLGWGIIATGTTNNGYSAVASGYSKTYTRGSSPTSGFHSQWYIDGAAAGQSGTQTVPAQANGTMHTVLHQIEAN